LEKRFNLLIDDIRNWFPISSSAVGPRSVILGALQMIGPGRSVIAKVSALPCAREVLSKRVPDSQRYELEVSNSLLIGDD
jgi:hypothetical protein